MSVYENIGFFVSVAFSLGLVLGAGVAWVLVMKWEPIHATEEEIM